jgi:hypothetical protein
LGDGANRAVVLHTRPDVWRRLHLVALPPHKMIRRDAKSSETSRREIKMIRHDAKSSEGSLHHQKMIRHDAKSSETANTHKMICPDVKSR